MFFTFLFQISGMKDISIYLNHPKLLQRSVGLKYRLTPGYEAVPDIPEAVYSTARGARIPGSAEVTMALTYL